MFIMSNVDYEQVDTINVEGECTMVTEMDYIGLTGEESEMNLCSDDGMPQRS